MHPTATLFVRVLVRVIVIETRSYDIYNRLRDYSRELHFIPYGGALWSHDNSYLFR